MAASETPEKGHYKARAPGTTTASHSRSRLAGIIAAMKLAEVVLRIIARIIGSRWFDQYF